MQANHEDCHGSRARHKPAGEAKQCDLPSGGGAAREAALDVFGVGALVGVLVFAGALFWMGMPMRFMFMFMFMFMVVAMSMRVAMAVACMRVLFCCS